MRITSLVCDPAGDSLLKRQILWQVLTLRIFDFASLDPVAHRVGTLASKTGKIDHLAIISQGARSLSFSDVVVLD